MIQTNKIYPTKLSDDDRNLAIFEVTRTRGIRAYDADLSTWTGIGGGGRSEEEDRLLP